MGLHRIMPPTESARRPLVVFERLNPAEPSVLPSFLLNKTNMVAITLLALLASAASVSATLNLTLKVFGTSSARGVGALRLTTELVNTGNEALTLLKDPRTILRKIPTNSFTIVNEDTFERPKFIGAQVKYSPAAAVASGLKDGFTILAPGASFSMDHDCNSLWRRLFLIRS
jgi:hypothetical protein